MVPFKSLTPPPPPPPGQTPLHVATECGHQDVLKQLVNAKADVNVRDSRSGKTALHYSIDKGNLPVTGYLITEVGEGVCV